MDTLEVDINSEKDVELDVHRYPIYLFCLVLFFCHVIIEFRTVASNILNLVQSKISITFHFSKTVSLRRIGQIAG